MEQAKTTKDYSFSRVFNGMFFLGFVLLLAFPGVLRSQQHADFDQYKLQITGSWFRSNPSGTLQGQSDTVVEGSFYGMYFFGYGNFVSTDDHRLFAEQALQPYGRLRTWIAIGSQQ